MCCVSFRLGDKGSRRRQAHAQGLPPAAFWGTGTGGGGPIPQKGIPKGLIPWAGAGRARRSPRGMPGEMGRAEGRNAGFCGRKRAVASVAPIPALDVRRDSIPRRACLPYLMGKAPQLSTLSAMSPKSGAPTLKRFCPAGANSVEYAHRQRPLPVGQGSVISPCCPMIPSVQKRERKRSCGSIACPCTEKMGKTAQRGKNKR